MEIGILVLLFSLLVHLCFLVHKGVQEKQERGDEVGDEANFKVPNFRVLFFLFLLLPDGGGD